MGTWGWGPFENDVAADWVDEVDSLESDGARADAVWRALMDVVALDGVDEAEEAGDIAVAAAAWITAPLTGTQYRGGPQADPPVAEDLRLALAHVLSIVLSPDSDWMARQREGGSAALEAVHAINAALGNPPPLAPAEEAEEHSATVTPVVDFELAWSRQDPHFRVYFFSGDAEAGWRVRADDITDGEVTDAFIHADEHLVHGEWIAIALIVDRAGEGPGQIWLVGKDPREQAVTDDDHMRLRRMSARAAWREDDGETRSSRLAQDGADPLRGDDAD